MQTALRCCLLTATAFFNIPVQTFHARDAPYCKHAPRAALHKACHTEKSYSVLQCVGSKTQEGKGQKEGQGT